MNRRRVALQATASTELCHLGAGCLYSGERNKDSDHWLSLSGMNESMNGKAANHQLQVSTVCSPCPPGRTLRVLWLANLDLHLATLAGQFSQRLSYSSTRWNAGGLIFRVRDGYGSCPAAVAASMPIRGIEPQSQTTIGVSYVRSSLRLDPFIGPVRIVWRRPVSACGLNTSLPRCAHPKSIELVFYERSRRCLFSMWVSGLDAFSPYPVSRRCPARALSDNRYTSGDQP